MIRTSIPPTVIVPILAATIARWRSSKWSNRQLTRGFRSSRQARLPNACEGWGSRPSSPFRYARRACVWNNSTWPRGDFFEFFWGLFLDEPGVLKILARGVEMPDDIEYGGVIGTALVVDIVTRSRSVWFNGPAALVLADARPEPFRPVRGQVGLFTLPGC